MNMIATPLSAATLLAAMLCSPCGAMADEDFPVRSSKDVRIVFESLDRNRDEQISRSEATIKGSVSKRFDGIDADGDGYLSKAEFAARPSGERFE